MSFKEQEHLQLTENELRQIFDQDPPLQESLGIIEEFHKKIGVYLGRIREANTRLDQIEDEKGMLMAQLKALDTHTREIKGSIASERYQIARAKTLITQRQQRINTRQKWLYKREVTARLQKLGRDLRLPTTPVK